MLHCLLGWPFFHHIERPPLRPTQGAGEKRNQAKAVHILRTNSGESMEWLLMTGTFFLFVCLCVSFKNASSIAISHVAWQRNALQITFFRSLSLSLLGVHAASMNSMTLRPDEQTQEEVVDSCDETWTAESGGGRRDFFPAIKLNIIFGN